MGLGLRVGARAGVEVGVRVGVGARVRVGVGVGIRVKVRGRATTDGAAPCRYPRHTLPSLLAWLGLGLAEVRGRVRG